MSYSDKEKQKEFQRRWLEKRKAAFFEGKSCPQCSSVKNLTLVGSKKTTSIWSRSDYKTLAANCTILCEDCYLDYISEKNSVDRRVHGHAGNTASPTYISWSCMIQRCCNPNQMRYDYYGGRGIKVCDRWKDSFENFLSDMGERPTSMTLDRIDPNGNYEPNNCRWADAKTQGANKCYKKAA